MWRRGIALGVIAALLVALSTAACRQVIGLPDGTGAGHGARACGLSLGTSACASCAGASCCAESSACAASAECAPHESCLAGCNGDPACRAQCTLDHLGDTTPELANLDACLASACEAECGLTCGALAGSVSEPRVASSCDGCLSSSSCEEARSCARSPDCQAYIHCLLACPTGDCNATCATLHPDGGTSFKQLETDAYGATCAAQCAFGNYWGCVGRVTWPKAKPGTLTAIDQVVDYGTGTVFSGLGVAYCLYCPCPGLPLVDGLTDDGGMVTLQVPQVIDGAGYGLNGCVQVTSTPTSVQVVPTIAYWGYPLSQPLGTATSPLTRMRAFTPSEITQALAAFQLSPDPSAGFLGGVVVDCLGSPASGVVVTSDAPVALVPHYGSGGSTSTDSDGTVAFLNVPAGSLTLTATPLALGKPSTAMRVNIQGGYVTEVQLWPTPTQ